MSKERCSCGKPGWIIARNWGIDPLVECDWHCKGCMMYRWFSMTSLVVCIVLLAFAASGK